MALGLRFVAVVGAVADIGTAECGSDRYPDGQSIAIGCTEHLGPAEDAGGDGRTATVGRF
jgi:hypothetical protein